MVFISTDFFLTDKALINKQIYLSYLINNYRENSVNFFFINLSFDGFFFNWGMFPYYGD